MRLRLAGIIVIATLFTTGCFNGLNQDQAAIERNIVAMEAAESSDQMLTHLMDPVEVEIIWNVDGEVQTVESFTLTHRQLRLGYFGGNIPGTIIDQFSKENGKRIIDVNGHRGETIHHQEGKFGIVRDEELVIGKEVTNTVQTFWQKVDEKWYMEKIQVTTAVNTVK